MSAITQGGNIDGHDEIAVETASVTSQNPQEPKAPLSSNSLFSVVPEEVRCVSYIDRAALSHSPRTTLVVRIYTQFHSHKHITHTHLHTNPLHIAEAKPFCYVAPKPFRSKSFPFCFVSLHSHSHTRVDGLVATFTAPTLALRGATTACGQWRIFRASVSSGIFCFIPSISIQPWKALAFVVWVPCSWAWPC